MIKRSVFKCVSGFDERYFMYQKTWIFVIACGRPAWIACMSGCAIVHHGGGSSDSARSMFSTVMTRESGFRFLKFHRGRFIAWGYRAAMGITSLIRLPLIAVVNGAIGLPAKKSAQVLFANGLPSCVGASALNHGPQKNLVAMKPVCQLKAYQRIAAWHLLAREIVGSSRGDELPLEKLES